MPGRNWSRTAKERKIHKKQERRAERGEYSLERRKFQQPLGAEDLFGVGVV